MDEKLLVIVSFWETVPPVFGFGGPKDGCNSEKPLSGLKSPIY